MRFAVNVLPSRGSYTAWRALYTSSLPGSSVLSMWQIGVLVGTRVGFIGAFVEEWSAGAVIGSTIVCAFVGGLVARCL
jgi:hypothetical protein